MYDWGLVLDWRWKYSRFCESASVTTLVRREGVISKFIQKPKARNRLVPMAFVGGILLGQDVANT